AGGGSGGRGRTVDAAGGECGGHGARMTSRMWKNNGLSIVIFALFLVSLGGHSYAGWKAHNEEEREHGNPEIRYSEFLKSSDFGETVFENWESEFLQMGFYVIRTTFLYQRGSSESKKPGGKEKVDEDPEKHRDDPKA